MKTLQNRIFTFFIIFLLILSIIYFIFSYVFYDRSNTQKVYSNYINLSNSITYNLDSQIQLLNNITLDTVYYLSGNPSIFDASTKSPNAVTLLNTYDKIFSILGPDLSAGQINIYFDNGYCIGNGFDTKFIMQSASTLPYYSDTTARNGSKYLTPISNYPGNPHLYEDNIVLARTFTTASGSYSGFLEVVQTKQRFYNYLEKVQRNNPDIDILIFDRNNGNLIYPTPQQTTDFNSSFPYCYSFIEDNPPLNMDFFTNPKTKDRKVAMYDNLTQYEWSVVILQPKQIMTAPLFKELGKLFIFIAVCCIVMFLLYNRLTQSLLAPLGILKRNVEKINMDTLLNQSVTMIPNPKIQTQEIKILNNSFEQMYDTLQKSAREVLILKEKENDANYRALQAIVDPHFIYNSISAITAMAESGRTQDIASFSRNICEIIRYTSNRTINQVPLRDEIHFTKQYLDCMKLRFGDDLQYKIVIPELLFDTEVPRLCLQTFAENSIKHGFGGELPLEILIQGNLDKDKWQISLSDNGIGFDEVDLEQLLTAVKESIQQPSTKETAIGGIGIINVLLRMHLKNKESFYYIENNISHGCTITIGQYIKEE